MNWVQINKRLFELEKKEELTDEQIIEWNTLLSIPIAGIIKRNEKNIRQTKNEERGKKNDDRKDEVSVHGHMALSETLL